MGRVAAYFKSYLKSRTLRCASHFFSNGTKYGSPFNALFMGVNSPRHGVSIVADWRSLPSTFQYCCNGTRVFSNIFYNSPRYLFNLSWGSWTERRRPSKIKPRITLRCDHRPSPLFTFFSDTGSLPFTWPLSLGGGKTLYMNARVVRDNSFRSSDYSSWVARMKSSTKTWNSSVGHDVYLTGSAGSMKCYICDKTTIWFFALAHVITSLAASVAVKKNAGNWHHPI